MVGAPISAKSEKTRVASELARERAAKEAGAVRGAEVGPGASAGELARMVLRERGGGKSSGLSMWGPELPAAAREELATRSGTLPTEELRRCRDAAALLFPVTKLSWLVCFEIGLPLLRGLL